MPKISIIVPIYNVEKYLPVCLDSIISQTFTYFELICVNDGSSDGCGQILAEYENKDIFSRHLRCRFDSGPTPSWVHSHQQTHKKIKPQMGLYFFYGAGCFAIIGLIYQKI